VLEINLCFLDIFLYCLVVFKVDIDLFTFVSSGVVRRAVTIYSWEGTFYLYLGGWLLVFVFGFSFWSPMGVESFYYLIVLGVMELVSSMWISFFLGLKLFFIFGRVVTSFHLASLRCE